MSWTVTGLAMPFDLETRHAFRRWKFLPGSLIIDGPVMLLRDHDNAQRLGRILRVRQLKAGLKIFAVARVQVPRGTPLSAGIYPIQLEEEGGVLIIRRARLEEVSVVKRSAYEEAKVA